jgi:hypothetical protein
MRPASKGAGRPAIGNAANVARAMKRLVDLEPMIRAPLQAEGHEVEPQAAQPRQCMVIRAHRTDGGVPSSSCSLSNARRVAFRPALAGIEHQRENDVVPLSGQRAPMALIDEGDRLSLPAPDRALRHENRATAMASRWP